VKTYSPNKLAKKIGRHREAIKEWISRGFIAASIKTPMSCGRTLHQFTDEDVEKIKLFDELVTFGFSRKRASEIAMAVHPGYSISTGNFNIIFSPNQSFQRTRKDMRR